MELQDVHRHPVVHAGLVPVTKRTHITIRFPHAVLRRLGQLRHGKTKLLKVQVHIPGGLRRASISRVCFAAGAIADSARPAGARACSTIPPRHR
ncbi:MAG: hypothetical protein ACXVXL_30495 [Solirubrobacteraceae bacterium]